MAGNKEMTRIAGNAVGGQHLCGQEAVLFKPSHRPNHWYVKKWSPSRPVSVCHEPRSAIIPL